VLVHTAKVRAPQRLALWLQLLLACSGGLAPRGAVLVARDQHRFRVVEQLQPLPPAAAQEHLGQLLQWCAEHRQRCWPLPPESGWAFARAELAQSGQGLSKARGCWEGGYRQRPERGDAVQALCFGADLPVAELLTPPLQQLALDLHGPLVQGWQERRP